MFSVYFKMGFLISVTYVVGTQWSCPIESLLYVHSSIAIILMGKRELSALLNLSSSCLMMVEWLFLPVPWGCLLFVIVVFPDHTHLLFFKSCGSLTQVKSTAEHSAILLTCIK